MDYTLLRPATRVREMNVECPDGAAGATTQRGQSTRGRGRGRGACAGPRDGVPGVLGWAGTGLPAAGPPRPAHDDPRAHGHAGVVGSRDYVALGGVVTSSFDGAGAGDPARVSAGAAAGVPTRGRRQGATKPKMPRWFGSSTSRP
ncbi:hypothetical protein B0I12_000372 [Microbacterium hydrothermale]|nr:hypothetical protein [Microbacterium hydrothermale]